MQKVKNFIVDINLHKVLLYKHDSLNDFVHYDYFSNCLRIQCTYYSSLKKQHPTSSVDINKFRSKEGADLYGTCGACSTSAVITRPSVNKLWLIFPASLARLSTAPDRPMHSLPARSTCTTNTAPVTNDSIQAAQL